MALLLMLLVLLVAVIADGGRERCAALRNVVECRWGSRNLATLSDGLFLLFGMLLVLGWRLQRSVRLTAGASAASTDSAR